MDELVEKERADAVSVWRRYQTWREGLPSAALFFLACLEVIAFLAVWAASITAVAAVVAAPLLFGMPEGLFVWTAVYVLAMAMATVNNRNHRK